MHLTVFNYETRILDALTSHYRVTSKINIRREAEWKVIVWKRNYDSMRFILCFSLFSNSYAYIYFLLMYFISFVTLVPVSIV